MHALIRNVIAGAGLLLFVGGGLSGIAAGGVELARKLSGGVFYGSAGDAVLAFIGATFGGATWLLASIDRRLEQTGPRN